MRILCSASDRARLEIIRRRLQNRGIRCEIREEPLDEEVAGVPFYPELWIREDDDFHSAAMIFASRDGASGPVTARSFLT